jgi:hypothetical protein
MRFPSWRHWRRSRRFPFLPDVVASSTDPLLLVTRLVPGEALFDVVD